MSEKKRNASAVESLLNAKDAEIEKLQKKLDQADWDEQTMQGLPEAYREAKAEIERLRTAIHLFFNASEAGSFGEGYMILCDALKADGRECGKNDGQPTLADRRGSDKLPQSRFTDAAAKPPASPDYSKHPRCALCDCWSELAGCYIAWNWSKGDCQYEPLAKED